MSDSTISNFTGLHLKEKELLSQAFEAFNRSIQKLNKYQKKLEQEIDDLHSELYLRNQELTNIVESLANGLIVTDLQGKIITYNQSTIVITGLSEEKVTDTLVNDLFGISILPKTLDEKGLQKIEHNFHQQFTFKKMNHEKIILDTSTALMQSKEGERLGIIINLNDITKIKRLEEEAQRKSRLTVMGEIAANVAHEIRNPLGSIELFISILKMDVAHDPEKIEIIDHIISGIHSMNHIISNLLEYTKPRPIILKPVNVHEIINNFMEFSKPIAYEQNIDMNLQFEEQESIINGDPELLKQIFHNIFNNAIQAMMPENGTLTIKLFNSIERNIDQLKLFQTLEEDLENLQPIKLLNISFQDTGKGMPDEVKRQIFDPFFTTKERGTGLGMSIIRNIIQSHKGLISIDSTINQGTTILVSFPLLIKNIHSEISYD